MYGKPTKADHDGTNFQVVSEEFSEAELCSRRFNSIWSDRGTFDEKWRDLAAHILPTRQRFLAGSDTNRGDRSRSKILDSIATRSARVMQAGLLAGMASPARPWFMLSTDNREMDKRADVARWLEDFRDAILGVFDKSNYYQSLGSLFGDEVVFGTSAMAIFEDHKKVIRCQVFPIGSYAIAQDDKGVVNQFVREFTLSVESAADRYGIDKLSRAAQQSHKTGRFMDKVVIRHAIWPRKDVYPGSPGTGGMAFEERFWEHTTGGSGMAIDTPTWGYAGSEAGERGQILERSGYREFPIIVARWDKNDDDVYGTDSPGMQALGDVKELQAQKKAYSNSLAKIVNPPMRADPSLEGKPLSIMAGATTFGSGANGKPSLEPVHEVQLRLSEVQVGMEQLRSNIEAAFMVPWFQMLLSDSRAQPPTAEEIRARVQEKSDILGPILERHSDDVFDKVIDRVAAIMMRRSVPKWRFGGESLVAQPPEILSEVELKTVYVSEVAQAQRLGGLMPLERHLTFVSNLAQMDPGVMDVVNLDAIAEEHRDVIGAPAKLHNDPEMVADVRMQRAQQMAAQQQATNAPGLAKAAKDLSETDPESDSALTRLLGGGAE